MHVRSLLTGGLLTAFLLTGCGAADGDGVGALPEEPTTSDGAAAGACLEGTEDCVDADLGGGGGAGPPDDLGELDVEAARRDAESLLGQSEEEVLELWGDVRVGRRGNEQFALIEDWRPGRKTIATEDDGTGTFRVVEVVLELDEGTETFTER